MPTSLHLAASFELGAFLALAVLAVFFSSTRKWAVVALGALTPLLLSLAVTSIRHLVFHDEEAGFVFHEIWITSLLPFVACLVFGIAAGLLLKRPGGLAARYILGLVPPAALAVILAITVPQ